MRIAVFEYKVVRSSPIGSCLLQLLRELCHEHEFTVFAAEFENPSPSRIRFVRIPTPTRPLAFLFISYHLLARLLYAAHRASQRSWYDLVMMVECNLSRGDVSYAHFCHRSYLRHHWRPAGDQGFRGTLRWLDHRLRAGLEPWVYRRVKHIVVPSAGLARELASEYPWTRGKIHCLPNPIDVDRFCIPDGFARENFRRSLGINPDDTVLTFVALGHFERKGLPLLLDAFVQLKNPQLKLLVVGGEADLVAVYRARADRLGLQGAVVFVGMQQDVRPYLWGAEAFVLPSTYETFSLVAFEAAAAGLPLIVSSFYGIEEFFQDGKHGLLVEPTPDGVCLGLARFFALPSRSREAMGNCVQKEVERYDKKNFVAAWRCYLDALVQETPPQLGKEGFLKTREEQ